MRRGIAGPTLLLLLCLLLLALPSPATARSPNLPLEDLVADSDLVVVGTLHNVVEHSTGGRDYGRGILTVSNSLCGRAMPVDRPTLCWSNLSAFSCGRVEHRQDEGRERLWLLTWRDGATVCADYPRRTLEADAQPEVARLLAT